MRGTETNAPRRSHEAIYQIRILVPLGRRTSPHVLLAFRDFPSWRPMSARNIVGQYPTLDLWANSFLALGWARAQERTGRTEMEPSAL